MDTHISREETIRVFSGSASPPEMNHAVSHLAVCNQCWLLAARVIGELRTEGSLAPKTGDSRSAVLSLIGEEERGAVRLHRAFAWCDELRDLSPEEQMERVRSIGAMHTIEVFEVLLGEAKRVSIADPYLGEQTAMTAHMLVDYLPEEYQLPLRNQYKAASMAVVANSRRLACDWLGARTAIGIAKEHLKQSMGPSLTEANILSIHGSIEYDMGNLETALGLLAKSLELFRSIGHIKGVAEVTVQESAAVLAANQPERALTRAEDALQFLTPQNARLLMLAKSIITESLVLLGRLPEALRNFTETEPLYQEVGGELTFLKVTYLRARILDALELNREAEKLFRRAINGLTDAEIYKDAFLIRLTFFESLFKRGAFRKAVQVCEEAINQLKQTGRVHTQMSQVWKDLLGAVEAEVLKEYHLADMRNYLIRHWASPAPRAPVFSGHSNSN